eukprot:Clim_evm72s77 gene=Clim_evmTU72s77
MAIEVTIEVGSPRHGDSGKKSHLSMAQCIALMTHSSFNLRLLGLKGIVEKVESDEKLIPGDAQDVLQGILVLLQRNTDADTLLAARAVLNALLNREDLALATANTIAQRLVPQNKGLYEYGTGRRRREKKAALETSQWAALCLGVFDRKQAIANVPDDKLRKVKPIVFRNALMALGYGVMYLIGRIGNEDSVNDARMLAAMYQLSSLRKVSTETVTEAAKVALEEKGDTTDSQAVLASIGTIMSRHRDGVPREAAIKKWVDTCIVVKKAADRRLVTALAPLVSSITEEEYQKYIKEHFHRQLVRGPEAIAIPLAVSCTKMRAKERTLNELTDPAEMKKILSASVELLCGSSPERRNNGKLMLLETITILVKGELDIESDIITPLKKSSGWKQADNRLSAVSFFALLAKAPANRDLLSEIAPKVLLFLVKDVLKSDASMDVQMAIVNCLAAWQNVIGEKVDDNVLVVLLDMLRSSSVKTPVRGAIADMLSGAETMNSFSGAWEHKSSKEWGLLESWTGKIDASFTEKEKGEDIAMKIVTMSPAVRFGVPAVLQKLDGMGKDIIAALVTDKVYAAMNEENAHSFGPLLRHFCLDAEDLPKKGLPTLLRLAARMAFHSSGSVRVTALRLLRAACGAVSVADGQNRPILALAACEDTLDSIPIGVQEQHWFSALLRSMAISFGTAVKKTESKHAAAMDFALAITPLCHDRHLSRQEIGRASKTNATVFGSAWHDIMDLIGSDVVEQYDVAAAWLKNHLLVDEDGTKAGDEFLIHHTLRPRNIATTRTLSEVAPKVAADVLALPILTCLHQDALKQFKQEDFLIAQMKDGQLFDHGVVDKILDKMADKNQKKESKLYSHEDQLWEAKVRAEQTAKMMKEGKFKFNKDQQKLVDEQLAKEKAVRAEVNKVLGNLNSAVDLLVASTASGAMIAWKPHVMALMNILLTLARDYLPPTVILNQILRALDGLSALAKSLSMLQRAACAQALLRLCGGDGVLRVSSQEQFNQITGENRLLDDESAVTRAVVLHEADWASENSRLLMGEKALEMATLHPSDIGLADFLQPGVEYVLEKRLQKLSLAGLSVLEVSSNKLRDSCVPLDRKFNLLIKSLSTMSDSDPKIAKKIQDVLIIYAEAYAATLKSGNDSEHLGLTILSPLFDATTHAESFIRDTAVKCLAFMPELPDDPMSKAHLAVLTEVPEESTRRQAEALWKRIGWTLERDQIPYILDLNTSQTSLDLIEPASKCLRKCLVAHPSAVSGTLKDILERYHQLLIIPEPERDAVGNLIKREYIDPCAGRSGLAMSIEKSADLIPSEEDFTMMITFFLTEGCGDRAESTRASMLSSATAVMEKTPGAPQYVDKVLPQVQGVLDRPAKTGQGLERQIDDAIRQAAVILLGTAAKHLPKEDERIPPIITKLFVALKTPSQLVQEAAADRLAPLIGSVKSVKDDGENLVKTMLTDLFEGPDFGTRRGAAYGLAAVIKGLGMPSLKQYEVLATLKEAMADKKSPKRREGGVMAFECLCTRLGRLFEPYVVQMLGDLLMCFGDGNKDVREAAEDASRAVMAKLSAHGVKLVLPTLLSSLDDSAWRTKQGSAEMLGFMAHCAPKQLSSALPQVVPKLVSSTLTDSHAKVQAAGKESLREIGRVIRNPEVQHIAPVLLDALIDPSKHTPKALQALLDTTFVHFIDAASLALLVPILQRAMKERSTDTKKMAAQIIGNIANLTETKDLLPYIREGTLLPGLQTILLDPIPELRALAAGALGKIVGTVGEENFPDVIPWCLDHLRAEGSSIDRAGAAQGLAEVLGGLSRGAALKTVKDEDDDDEEGNEMDEGTDEQTNAIVKRLDRLMEEFIIQTSSVKPHVREGNMLMFVFLPSVFKDRFLPYVADVLPCVLRGLADESEFVRDSALRAGQMIINNFADRSVELFLPNLEDGLFDDNWRIRQSSVQLMGDLLARIAGQEAKKGTTIGDEDDAFGTELGTAAILEKLGSGRRNRVLSGLYMARSDISPVVRQAALHVWKQVVHNTARTLRDIISTLMQLLLSSLASDSMDRKAVAARTLGDLVKKLSERVLPELIPTLESALKDSVDDPSRRLGVATGLGEMLKACPKDHLVNYVDSLLSLVQELLCDSDAEVQESAAEAFDYLHRAIGAQVIDEIVPSLLKQLDTHEIQEDPEQQQRLLSGLRQIISVKAMVVLPYIMPMLLATPATPTQARALSAIVGVAGSAINRYLGAALDTLLESAAEASVQKDDRSLEALEDATMALVNSVDHPQAVGILVSELSQKSVNDKPMIRLISVKCIGRLFQVHGVGEGSPMQAFVQDGLDTLLQRMADPAEEVLPHAHAALAALTATIRKEDQAQYVPHLVRCLQPLPTTSEGLVRGFCLTKGVGPILPMLLHGLIYGLPETKQQAAKGIELVVQRTSADALKPFVIQITGPLIRVVGDRFNWRVKAAILNALTTLIIKVGPMLKPFIPQLQTTFTKTLQDPNEPIRTMAAEGLGQISALHTRTDPLITDLCNSAAKNGTASNPTQATETSASPHDLCSSQLLALERVLEGIPQSPADSVRASILENLKTMMDPDKTNDKIASAAAKAQVYLGRFLDDKQFADEIVAPATASTRTFGSAQMLAELVKAHSERVMKLGHFNACVIAATADAGSEKIGVAMSGSESVAGLMLLGQETGTEIPQTLIEALCEGAKQGVGDTRRAAIDSIATIAEKDIGVVFQFLKPIMEALVVGLRERNIPVKLASERATIEILKQAEDSVMGQTNEILSPIDAKFFIDYHKRVLSRKLKEAQDNDYGQDGA